MKKKPRPPSAKEAKRRQYGGFFHGRPSLSALADAKNKLSPVEYPDLVQWINSQRVLKRRLFPVVMGADLTQLQRFTPPEPAALDRELAWSAVLLIPHANLIQRFVSSQTEFMNLVLRGDTAGALSILDVLDAEIGPSIWSMSARIAGLQLHSGLEGQKAYVRQLRERASSRNVASYIAHHTSVRNESTVTLAGFLEERDEIFERMGGSGSSLVGVLRYYLTGALPTDSGGLAMLLATGTAGSIVDYYGMFVDACRRIASHLPDYARLAAGILDGFVNCRDQRLTATRNALSAVSAHDPLVARNPSTERPDDEATRQQLAVELYAEFLAGNEGAHVRIAEQYYAHPEAPEWLEVAARATGGSEAAPLNLADEVAKRIHALIGRAGRSEQETDALGKLALNLPGTAWSAAIRGLLEANKNAEPDSLANADTFFELTALPHQLPWLLRLAPPSVRSAYSVPVLDMREHSSAAAAIAALYIPSEASVSLDALVPSEAALASSLFRFRAKEYDQAITLAAPEQQSADNIRRARAIQLVAWSLYFKADFAGCLDAVCQAYLLDADLMHVCPVRELADTITTYDRHRLGAQIELSVFYDIAARMLGTAYDVQRKDAFEDYLIAQGVERPTQLIIQPTDGHTEKYVYFLRYLCVPPILETSLGDYQSDEDLAQERIEICSRLVRLDPENAAAYKNEIKTLVREQTIGRHFREIDQNRVFVNIEGVRALAVRRLTEPFNRYLDFVRHGIGVSADKTETTTALIDEVIRGGDTSAIDFLALPENEPANLLSGIVRDIADLYFLSPAHGLERYLSTRIRHGVLEGRLRTPLSDERIVTSRIRATNTYEPDRYWAGVLGVKDPDAAKALERRLAKFGRSFDDLVQRLASERIRACRAAPKSPAVFQYVVKNSYVRFLLETTPANTTVDVFVENVIQGMRSSLEEFLPVAREAVQQTKNEAIKLLASLQDDVYELCVTNGRDASLFEQAVSKARTAMQHEFDHVASWFHARASDLQEPFTLEVAADVAIRSVQVLHRGFTCEVESTGASPEWTERSVGILPHIVDLLFPALQNAAEYGKGGPNAASASLLLAHQGTVSTVRITNELPPECDVTALRTKLAKLRSEQDDGSYLDIVVNEGGSGIHKLRSHLEALFTDSQLALDIVNGAFVIEFSVASPEDTQ